MKYLHIKLKKHVPVDFAWEYLDTLGLEVLFSSENPDGDSELFAKVTKLSLKEFKKLPFVESCTYKELDAIDWDSQWKAHGLDYSDGLVHLDLKPYGLDKRLLLKPGPGFGDMSHPTTHLVLEMMSGRVQNKTVLDIGSGSGVLSLAAAAWGASKVIGIDIDPQALLHAEENARLNNMQNALTFLLPSEGLCSGEAVILMNMIQSEQKEALRALKLSARGEAIVSGILAEEAKAYLKLAKSWGWELQEEKEKAGWLGMRFLILS